MKPETKFRSQKVLPFLRTLKNTHRFPIQQAAISGTPDLLLCCAGRFVALELKSAEGAPTPLQKYNLEQVLRCGGVAIVAWPHNWDEVKQQLTNLDQGGTWEQKKPQ